MDFVRVCLKWNDQVEESVLYCNFEGRLYHKINITHFNFNFCKRMSVVMKLPLLFKLGVSYTKIN